MRASALPGQRPQSVSWQSACPACRRRAHRAAASSAALCRSAAEAFDKNVDERAHLARCELAGRAYNVDPVRVGERSCRKPIHRSRGREICGAGACDRRCVQRRDKSCAISRRHQLSAGNSQAWRNVELSTAARPHSGRFCLCLRGLSPELAAVSIDGRPPQRRPRAACAKCEQFPMLASHSILATSMSSAESR